MTTKSKFQLSGPGPVAEEKSRSVSAESTLVTYSYENEPIITGYQHACLLTGLTSGETYIYRVGSEGSWSEWNEFRTPDVGSTFSMIYFGDTQNGIKSQWSRVIRKAYQQVPNCSFMLHGGDLINRTGRDSEWQEWFDAGGFIYSTVPQMMTPGNHDYNDLVLDPHWRNQFTQPDNGPKGLEETCFFIDYKNLRLISIDSATGNELENENGYEITSQTAWLDSVLSSNTKAWVIVTTHLPFYSTKESRDNPQLREHFQPLLEKYDVDLVLTGHDHSYGRGMASDNPEVKPTVVYVVSVSGAKMYEAGDKMWMQKKGAGLQLYQAITITSGKLEFGAYTADGELFDHFILQKKNKKKSLKELR